MAIRGQVDGMVGSYVVGWALAEPDRGKCEISILDDADQVIAKGPASSPRPDLISLGIGRTDLAFRIAIKNPPEHRTLRILANGENIPGSPIMVGAGVYDGDCVIEGATITGWITERVHGFKPPVITVLNQFGIMVGKAESLLDTINTDTKFRPARFAVELDDRCFGGGEMRLDILANGVKFAERPCNLRLQGNLEIINQQTCAGWLISPDAPERCFEIEIFQDGVLAGATKCDISRDDVSMLFPKCTTPAFSLNLPKPESSLFKTTKISLRFRDSVIELFDGPYVIASQAAAIAAAQHLARLVNWNPAGLGDAERAVAQLSLSDFIAKARTSHSFVATKQLQAPVSSLALSKAFQPRLNIIIPIYRDPGITSACIQSVLAHRNPATDFVILINDASPDAQMADMLKNYKAFQNVFVLTNESNIGFIQSVNRGLAFAGAGDFLLLNSDTVLFAGGLDEMCRIAHSSAEIATVTALSSNATIFSYPHARLCCEELTDITWPQLAEIALAENAGLAIGVPTGHGFCLLIKSEVLQRAGNLDEAFGRGYGEENDLCMRAANLGYRHVVAAGVLVQHRESVSFTGEKSSLLKQNLLRLNAMYPEYTSVIMDFEARDGLRSGRWALDKARLKRTVEKGHEFVLLVSNALEGGTSKAISEIEKAAGPNAANKITLACQANGYVELSSSRPSICAMFSPDEIEPLFEMISVAQPKRIMVHQLLGYSAAFINYFDSWAVAKHTIYYAHDFYPLCPRVTMIDALEQFCDVADSATCARCVAMDGAHDASKLTGLSPAAHRELFSRILQGFRHVVTPSSNTACYFQRVFPNLAVTVIPNPEPSDQVAATARTGANEEVLLLGAIGHHKGSAKLLEVAKRAKLNYPQLQFRVIGYTDIDNELLALGNVIITGRYEQADLPALFSQASGRLALFLPSWPETYSYTLSEVVKYGFIPLVPDIGAPAERVRAAGYGVVFPFPVNAEQVLKLITEIGAGRLHPLAKGATPAGLYPSPSEIETAVAILTPKSKSIKKPVPAGAS